MALIHEMLRDLVLEQGCSPPPDDCAAPLLKTLLAHSASWDSVPPSLANRELPERYRLIGYGEAELARVLSCTDQRVTLIGWGMIRAGEAHAYDVPLPDALASVVGWRRLTITLGWLTPTLPSHQKYRQAILWLTDYWTPKTVEGRDLLNVSRQAEYQTVRRGTLQHEVFEGNRVAGYEAAAVLPLQVNCAEDAGHFDEAIPYGVAATLEVAPELGVEIYEEIRARIRQPVLVQSRGPA